MLKLDIDHKLLDLSLKYGEVLLMCFFVVKCLQESGITEQLRWAQHDEMPPPLAWASSKVFSPTNLHGTYTEYHLKS